MTKTQNFNLLKPESNDPLRVEDFNENANIIDAALGNLNTAVAAAGNCKIETGSYTGNGEYGYGTSVAVKFSKQPLVVFIGGGGYNAVMIRGNSHGVSIDYNGSVRAVTPTWGNDGTVKWYSNANNGHQMNISNTTYGYFALLN